MEHPRGVELQRRARDLGLEYNSMNGGRAACGLAQGALDGLQRVDARNGAVHRRSTGGDTAHLPSAGVRSSRCCRCAAAPIVRSDAEPRDERRGASADSGAGAGAACVGAGSSIVARAGASGNAQGDLDAALDGALNGKSG